MCIEPLAIEIASIDSLVSRRENGPRKKIDTRYTPIKVVREL